MKVAIIGCNSFIAGYIINNLISEGFYPDVFGKKPVEKFPNLNFFYFEYPSQILDFKILLNYDVIIYTAGAGIQSNKSDEIDTIYQLNAFIPIQLCNFLLANNFTGKMMTFGSYFEIGNEISKTFYLETDVIASLNEVPNYYCSSKRLLSRYFSSISTSFNFFHLILPNIYGTGENANRLIPYIIGSIRNKQEVRLTSGEQVRQYLHARDVAKTVTDIIKNNYKKGIYNVSSEEPIQIRQLVKKIILLLGLKGHTYELGKFGLEDRHDISMPYLLLNCSKAKSTFRDQSRTSIEEGIIEYLV